MTWEDQGPANPQDPYAPGAQQPPEQLPPPGYPPGGQVPPPGYPPQGQVPPAGYPPQGQVPPPGAQPPPYAMPQADPWAAPPQQPPVPPPPPPPQYTAPPPEPMWQPPPAFPLAPDAYAVNISFDREAQINRLWGIPIVGQVVRLILLIPHFILLLLVAIVASIMLLFTWIPILLLGRFPGWGYRWIGGYIAWSQRVGAYAALMTGSYPPFSLSGEDYPITIRYDEGVRINRLWGIPIIGHIVRWVVLIPHYIILWVMGIVAFFLAIFAWVPVLFLGRQADVVYTILGGYFRWLLRVYAYGFMMVDRYPPFSLGEDDPRL